ncbi:hypothetical protein [Marinicrinis lubricantis]|uniref:Copper amine oxidase-like N-terminal domain-containing protein n=1 Tax=Marinicrinis lubricantis TaxID=2086470 RepID=A0ABW1IMZ6_9BACL
MKKLAIGIISGAVILYAASVSANNLKEYILNEADYHIQVNQKSYTPKNPVLNLNGTTYVPLRA